MNPLRPIPLVAALAALAGPARGEPTNGPAPALTAEAARAIAKSAFTTLTGALSPTERGVLTGAYVAFDRDAKDAVAMAACDDDGDYVVVVSDAMLTLADFVAHAEAVDAARGTHTLEAYAARLGKEQRAGQRLLPPAAGAFDPAPSTPDQKRALDDEQTKRFAAILGDVLAVELAHALQGDVHCAHPTATHEHGDDVWTDAEEREAERRAFQGYAPSTTARADVAGTRLAIAAGLDVEPGAQMLAPFWAGVEANGAEPPAASYLRLHRANAMRAAIVRAAAARARSEPSAAPDKPKP